MKKGIELLEQYPKASEVVLEWYKNKMKDSLNISALSEDIKESFNDYIIGLDHISVMIDTNPRFLFDVLDENDIYVEILVDYKSNIANFSYTVISDEMYSNPLTYISRKHAELAAIEQAFKLLENL
jgi:hypothetical protein